MGSYSLEEVQNIPSLHSSVRPTVDANSKGDFSPLFGICMGFQWLLIAATDGQLALDPSDGTQMDAENISLPLDFTASAKDGRLMQNAPDKVFNIFAERNVTMNNHHYGIYWALR